MKPAAFPALINLAKAKIFWLWNNSARQSSRASLVVGYFDKLSKVVLLHVSP